MKKSTTTMLALAAAALGLALSIKFSAQFAGGQPNLPSAKSEQNTIESHYQTILLYPKKNQLPTFQLFDQNAKAFDKHNFSAKLSVIFSGYTNCPDVCPTTLNDLNHLYQALSESAREKMAIILLSVDPERDTPEKIRQYLSFFNDKFIGISGDKTNIDRLTMALGAVYKLNLDEGEFYSVDHSARLFLVDEQGRRVGIIDSQNLQGPTFDRLVQELEQYLDKR